MLIRPRADGDLAACAELVRDVHAADRYPRFLPEDLRSFLVAPDAYGAWVADWDGQVAGHVALHPRSLRDAMEVAAAAAGRAAAQLAAVARLFVSPRARGRGAGHLLLDTASAAAAARGLRPVLDVDTELSVAIALYESRGWTRAGTITVCFSDNRSLTEHVYLGPVSRVSPDPVAESLRD